MAVIGYGKSPGYYITIIKDNFKLAVNYAVGFAARLFPVTGKRRI